MTNACVICRTMSAHGPDAVAAAHEAAALTIERMSLTFSHELPTFFVWSPGPAATEVRACPSAKAPAPSAEVGELWPSGIREALAAYSHDRAWSGWMKYQASKCESMCDGDGKLIGLLIPQSLVERWSRQMNTLYLDLPENEKKSDRDEADRMLSLMAPFHQELISRGGEEMGETDRLRSGVSFLRKTADRLNGNGCTPEYIAEALTLGLQLLDDGEDIGCFSLADDSDEAVWKLSE